MAASQAFIAHCLELLASHGHTTARPMFGGHGLRIDGLFVALIAFDCLYLKVDDISRPHFEAATCAPFTYTGKGKPITMSYWTVPPQAMESPPAMQPWARLALDAALRAKASKRKAAPARPRATRVDTPASKAKPPAAVLVKKSTRSRG
jgi:DNA transformation protein